MKFGSGECIAYKRHVLDDRIILLPQSHHSPPVKITTKQVPPWGGENGEGLHIAVPSTQGCGWSVLLTSMKVDLVRPDNEWKEKNQEAMV